MPFARTSPAALIHVLALVLGLSGCTVLPGGGSSYVKEDGVWSYRQSHGWDGSDTSAVRGADPMTFQVIDSIYAKDRRSVYYRGKLLPGADPESFSVVSESAGGAIGADRNVVFCAAERLEGSHPASFALLSDGYAKDANRVYYFCNGVPDADPATFGRVGRYWQDRAHVYHLGKRVEGLDPRHLVQHENKAWAWNDSVACVEVSCLRPDDIASFRAVRGVYARDRLSWYAAESGVDPRKMAVIDPASFVVIDDYWARDRTTMYWTGRPLAGVNPDTFEIISAYKGKASGACYDAGKKTPGNC